MKYILLYLIAPFAICFFAQSILCSKVKNKILCHGMLIFPIAFIVFGTIMMFAQHGDIFSGLGVMAAVLWFVSACCAFLGYGAAWGAALIIKRRAKTKRN